MENRYYGTGDIIESATGYLVKVGEPVFDDKVTANESGDAYILVGSALVIKDDTQYLVTLEVNGEVKLYRELWMSGNGSTANEVALSDYTYTMDAGAIGGLTEDDVVIARFEPVEVYTSDAFRTAVSKVAPKAEGGGSGGGVLVVHEVNGALDKTYKQIVDALHASGVILEWTHENGMIEVFWVVDYGEGDSSYLISFHTNSAQTSAGGKHHYYSAESENGYPVNDD